MQAERRRRRKGCEQDDSGFSFISARCQIGLGLLVNPDLQVSLLIFKWLQVQALGEPQGDI